VQLRDCQATLGEIARERVPREPRQRYARPLLALARDAQPVIAAWISLDVADRGADQFTGTQSRRIAVAAQPCNAPF
jgi:hypothetical protein